jgi:hypothetical protein
MLVRETKNRRNGCRVARQGDGFGKVGSEPFVTRVLPAKCFLHPEFTGTEAFL